MNSSTTFPNPYHILGIKPTSTRDEAKSAFRRMAKMFHPDVSQDPKAAIKFQAVSAAWEQIKDNKVEPKKVRESLKGSYKVYEIVPANALNPVIIRSEPFFDKGTVFNIMKGERMFKFALDKRRRVPFDVTAGGMTLKFRSAEF